MVAAWRRSPLSALEAGGLTVNTPMLGNESSANVWSNEPSNISSVAVSDCGVLCGCNILAWKRPCGGYTMPSGKLDEEDGVSIQRCASRELQEECGIAIAEDQWSIPGAPLLKYDETIFELILCAVKVDHLPGQLGAGDCGIKLVNVLQQDFPVMAGNALCLNEMTFWYKHQSCIASASRMCTRDKILCLRQKNVSPSLFG